MTCKEHASQPCSLYRFVNLLSISTELYKNGLWPLPITTKPPPGHLSLLSETVSDDLCH